MEFLSALLTTENISVITGLAGDVIAACNKLLDVIPNHFVYVPKNGEVGLAKTGLDMLKMECVATINYLKWIYF